MAGRGVVTEADLEIHPRVLMLAKDGTWQYAVDPVHYDKERAGAGLGRSFALELVKQNPDITVGLVPAACGGTSITPGHPAHTTTRQTATPTTTLLKKRHVRRKTASWPAYCGTRVNPIPGRKEHILQGKAYRADCTVPHRPRRPRRSVCHRPIGAVRSQTLDRRTTAGQPGANRSRRRGALLRLCLFTWPDQRGRQYPFQHGLTARIRPSLRRTLPGDPC